MKNVRNICVRHFQLHSSSYLPRSNLKHITQIGARGTLEAWSDNSVILTPLNFQLNEIDEAACVLSVVERNECTLRKPIIQSDWENEPIASFVEEVLHKQGIWRMRHWREIVKA